MNDPIAILLVDDRPADIELALRAFRRRMWPRMSRHV
jgi:hypothetical protein